MNALGEAGLVSNFLSPITSKWIQLGFNRLKLFINFSGTNL